MARSFAAQASASFAAALRDLGLGEEAAELADPREIGRRAALIAAAAVTWREHLGPLLESKDVASLLGVGTRQAVADLRARKRLLGLERQDGRIVYPAFQFGADGRPFPRIPAILELFRGASVDAWTLASWFVTPQSALDGRSPAEWLAAGRDAERVLVAARRTAARMRR